MSGDEKKAAKKAKRAAAKEETKKGKGYSVFAEDAVLRLKYTQLIPLVETRIKA